jgi:hypothetical protein
MKMYLLVLYLKFQTDNELDKLRQTIKELVKLNDEKVTKFF